MKLKQTLSFITALTLTVGVAWADTVKIGFNVPLTGFAAADGESALTGAKLAVKQANTAGGINGKQIELVYCIN
jgi:branched-chain amino acid transport system substrate-binding protein